MDNIIEVKNVSKTYKMGKISVKALDDIDLSIKRGEIVVILGASGSGKTTLLNVLSGLEVIDKNKNSYIKYAHKTITQLSDRKLTKLRRDKLGFIFQTYNLLENITVYENVLIGRNLSHKKADVDEILKILNLDRHKNKTTYKLSGGERQRVAIARSLAKEPEVMFCDEPTGALDEVTGKKVLKSLVDVNNKYNTTLLIVTHNPGISLIGDRIIRMNSGKIIESTQNKRINPLDIPWG